MNQTTLGALRPCTAPRTTRQILAAVLTTMMLAVGLTGTIQATTSTANAASLSANTYEYRVQQLVNERRAARGLPRLSLASCPESTAERWARYLAANNAFYHQSMTRVLNTCNATYAAENLGRGTMTPRRLVQMWMESPTHRAVMLSSKPRRIGIGAAIDGRGRWVIAANFIRP